MRYSEFRTSLYTTHVVLVVTIIYVGMVSMHFMLVIIFFSALEQNNDESSQSMYIYVNWLASFVCFFVCMVLYNTHTNLYVPI